MSDRTMSQRARDDEDHRHAMCGLTFDARHDEELQDFQQRHYDFNIFGGPQVCSSGLITANWPRGIPTGPCMQVAHGDDPAKRASSEQPFAPGSSRARYPLGAKQGPRAWEETPARTGAVSLVPPPLDMDGEAA